MQSSRTQMPVNAEQLGEIVPELAFGTAFKSRTSHTTTKENKVPATINIIKRKRILLLFIIK